MLFSCSCVLSSSRPSPPAPEGWDKDLGTTAQDNMIITTIFITLLYSSLQAIHDVDPKGVVANSTVANLSCM